MGYIVTEAADLPPRWRERCVAWAQSNDLVSEIWLFGSRGPKGDAHSESDVDIGLVLMPKGTGATDWALGNYVALRSKWRADLEAIVQRHVSLVPMVAGNEADEEVRSTGFCLWRRRP